MDLNSHTTITKPSAALDEPKPPRRIFCVINCRAGTAVEEQREAIREAFAACRDEHGLESMIEICQRPRHLSRIVDQAIAAAAVCASRLMAK